MSHACVHKAELSGTSQRSFTSSQIPGQTLSSMIITLLFVNVFFVRGQKPGDTTSPLEIVLLGHHFTDNSAKK